MTKEEAIKEINDTQDFYVDELIKIINHVNKDFDNLKEVDFTSPTGTGKTVMIAKLINKMPDYFFVVTTLSRGQLRIQIEDSLKKRTNQNNFFVFGLNDYTKNTRLQLADFKRMLESKKDIVWIRDEGHIATNRWQEVLRDRAISIINFSATNKTNNGIQCNFTHTMMLRTVTQQMGSIEDALKQLLLVKTSHINVAKYNPCALFRVLNNDICAKVIDLCGKYNLKVINITDEAFDMSSLCEDDNEYDVIINKFKITEGIDLKRCHVIYMDNKPGNESTVVQVIGRSRRNALLWRDDINILSEANKKLLEDTRRSFIYYNVDETRVEQNDNGELSVTLCDTISVEALKPNINISVVNGRLSNGLRILELEGKTGSYFVKIDPETGFNVVDNEDFYKDEEIESNSFLFKLTNYNYNIRKIYFKPTIVEYFNLGNKWQKPRVDKFKFSYRVYEAYCLSKNLNFNYEIWRDRLNINDDAKNVKNNEWNAFVREIKKILSINDVRLFYSEMSSTLKTKLRKESIVIKVKYDRKRILCGEKYCGSYLKPELYEYIDFIEIVDNKTQYKIHNKILNFNVLELNTNKFAVASHPFTKYFIERGYNNLKDLKSKVKSAKGSSILGCKVSFLKEMLSSISSFEEIDSFNVEYYDLKTLNQKLQLRLSKKEIDEYVSGNYTVKTVYPKKNDYFYFRRFDKKTKKYVDLTSQELFISKSDFLSNFLPYKKKINDREIAIIGTDTMHYLDHVYSEDKNVTSKITKYCKFNKFISKKYESYLYNLKDKTFKFDNNLGLDKKCNSCIGFCVEYYTKMKLYGIEQYKKFIDAAQREAKIYEINDLILVRASMLAYKETMCKCFGSYMNVLIPSLTIEQMIQKKNEEFLKLVTFYGNRTIRFLIETFGEDNLKNCYDPDLSVNHINALCDFITNDTIIDLKCTNSITEKHIKQILAYHYLSTKRDDISINKVIVYDAISNKSVIIDL